MLIASFREMYQYLASKVTRASNDNGMPFGGKVPANP